MSTSQTSLTSCDLRHRLKRKGDLRSLLNKKRFLEDEQAKDTFLISSSEPETRMSEYDCKVEMEEGECSENEDSNFMSGTGETEFTMSERDCNVEKEEGECSENEEGECSENEDSYSVFGTGETDARGADDEEEPFSTSHKMLSSFDEGSKQCKSYQERITVTVFESAEKKEKEDDFHKIRTLKRGEKNPSKKRISRQRNVSQRRQIDFCSTNDAKSSESHSGKQRESTSELKRKRSHVDLENDQPRIKSKRHSETEPRLTEYQEQRSRTGSVEPHKEHRSRTGSIEPHKEYRSRIGSVEPHKEHRSRTGSIEHHKEQRSRTGSIEPHKEQRSRTGSIEPHKEHRSRTGSIEPHKEHTSRTDSVITVPRNYKKCGGRTFSRKTYAQTGSREHDAEQRKYNYVNNNNIDNSNYGPTVSKRQKPNCPTIIDRICSYYNREPEQICLFLVDNLEDICHLLGSSTQIQDVKTFVKVVSKGMTSSLTNSHRSKFLFSLRGAKFFERSDLHDELKTLQRKTNLNSAEESFLEDLTDLMSVMADLASLPLSESVMCNFLLEHICYYFEDSMKHLKQKLTKINEIQQSGRLQTKDSNIIQFMTQSDMYILPDISRIKNNTDKELIQPHVIGSPFENDLHFLLYSFTLFREDFIRPLCRGFRNYIAYLKDRPSRDFRDPDVRVFEDVTLVSTKCVNGSGIAWEIHIENMRYHPQILKYGSLLCFSCDEFSSLFYGTVANRTAESMRRGNIDVQFIDAKSETLSKLTKNKWVMLESRSFYPAYSSTLKTLKHMFKEIENQRFRLPLEPYLIGHKVEPRLPKYLEMADEVSFRCLLKYGNSVPTKTYTNVCITDFSQWPSADELGLDDSQYAAIKLALTNEIALIQGPPGTGKTLMGERLAEFLLKNRSIWRKSGTGLSRPLLLISYTNHSLDQFLTELIKKSAVKTEKIVRIGSRCQEPQLEKCNIKEYRRAIKRAQLYRSFPKRHSKTVSLNRYKIDAFRKGIVHQFSLVKEMSVIHFTQLSYQTFIMPDEDFPDGQTQILSWLQVERFLRNDETAAPVQDNNEWSEEDVSEADKDRIIESFEELLEQSHEEWSAPWMALDEQTLKYWTNVSEKEKKNIFRRVCEEVSSMDMMTPLEAERVINISRLDVTDRWRLYRYWIWKATQSFREEAEAAEQSFEEACQIDSEATAVIDVHIMRNAHLVAMTTTGAAQYSAQLQAVAPAVVIVEEAAQVAEQHVISALSSSCQHLIMIGDHQQLQPSFNDFQLCRKYKTDVSLFERWIRSGMKFQQLKLQHRMRPEMSSLLQPHIYEQLYDDESVFKYGHIKGMSSDLFFLDHNYPEEQIKDSLSHSNKHEAEILTKLYRHLILQDYSPSDITILASYKEQVYLLKSLIQNMEKTDTVLAKKTNKVRIAAIDNYQGEENKIILVSLVRSNFEKDIGFLRRTNRICVTLSRAREGLYIIGNTSLLREKSRVWDKVLSKAEITGNVGNILMLKCQKHGQEIAVKNPVDFDKAADGGCSKMCETRLECGHACSRRCHVNDESHQLPCSKPCLKRCPRGHKCSKTCGEDCGKCREKVTAVLPACGHTQEIFCFQDPDDVQCQERCTKTLDCGHRCQKKCGEKCNTTFDCHELIKIDAKCGHNIQIACCAKLNPECKVPCTKILQCGHACKGTCGKCFRGNLHQECKEKCTRLLICGHTCKKLCSVPCGYCTEKCETKCVHSKCENVCGAICVPCQEPCDWNCRRRCPNAYRCSAVCCEPCNRPRCDYPCNRILKCKHRCAGFFCEPCFCLECQEDDPKEIFFGNEDEAGAIFYQLPDCKHIFESSGLDTYMDSGNDDAVRRKECPRCKTPILNAQRYSNLIKAAQADIDKVKEEFVSSCGDVIGKYVTLREEFPDLSEIFRRMQSNARSVHEVDMLETFLVNRRTFVSAVSSLLDEIRALGDTHQMLITELRNLHLWLERRERFSEQQLDECDMEIKRFRLLWRAIKLRDSVDEKTEIEKIIDELDRKTLLKDKEEKYRTFLTDLEQKMGLSREEKDMIVKAMKYNKKGHWYKCQNGHIYTIGECGGAMQRSRCPECQAEIGGEGHRLAEGNQVAGEMDGARYAAWSEQANMENYAFD